MDFPGRDQLFAFATPAEFASFFPEYADTADGVISDKLIELSDGRGYACVLGIGILNFATNLTFLLGDAKRRGISISAVFILGVCGAYPGRGIDVLDVVRVDAERNVLLVTGNVPGPNGGTLVSRDSVKA